MRRSCVGLAMAALIAMAAVLSFPSCGHDQKLVSLQVVPSSFTFLTPAGSEQYTAVGTYIHPPATKDVTSQATWKVDDGIVSINAGLVSPNGTGCGGGTISATMPEGTGGASNIVIGYATVTVEDPSNPICPGGGKFANLNVAVDGNGSVTSLPAGISCPATCVATYDVGSSILLTASIGSGASTVTWGGCTTFTTTQCTVTIPQGGASVTATFR